MAKTYKKKFGFLEGHVPARSDPSTHIRDKSRGMLFKIERGHWIARHEGDKLKDELVKVDDKLSETEDAYSDQEDRWQDSDERDSRPFLDNYEEFTISD